ncbi:MAG: hypothetical protein IJI60_02725 [Bacilli bacterium]|nr:hypothetical protein [Bacilli bacterium]
MPKIKIRVSIIQEEKETKEEVNAIYQDNIFKYQEDKKTKVILDLNQNILLRENKELKMKYIFQEKEETDGIIESKELGKKIMVKIKTKKIERKENDIKITFQVEDQSFLYHIEVLK